MITFPDVSSYQAGLTIQPGTQVVIAKASEGTTYADPSFADFESQAARVGAVFSGYHFLHGGNDSGQAQFCHNIVGSVPVMLDVEASGASFADCLGFIDAMHSPSLGGRVWGAYLPQWYWSQIGKPDLTPLRSRGVVLVSSNYSSLSGGAGWTPYGGMVPAVWQFTSGASYAGQTIDMNSFSGTADELKAIILGENDMDMNTLVPFSTTFKAYFDSTGGTGFGDKMAANFPSGGTAPFGVVDSWAAMSSRAAYLKAAEVDAKLDTLTSLVQQLLAK